MPLLTDNRLHWKTLTGVQNRIDSPNSWLQSNLFTGEETHASPVVEQDILRDTRKMGGFVKEGAKALLLRGRGYDTEQFKFPRIFYKMAFDAHKYLSERAPGQSNVLTGVAGADQSAIMSSARTWIARDMTQFDRYITDQIEWMCGRILEDSLVYDASVGASEETSTFQISYGRSAANTISSGATADNWDNQSSGENTADPAVMVRAGKIVAAKRYSPSICLMGKNVSAAFVGNTIVRKNLDPRRLNQAGPIPLGGDVRGEGIVYEGSYAGLEFWTLDRTVDIYKDDMTTVAVSGADIINPDSAYLLSLGRSDQFQIDYGPIHDWEAFQAGTLAMKRFAKAWTVGGDENAAFQAVETRPLPRILDPDYVVELKPLAG